MLPDVGEREQYYRGALRGLRFVEARRASGRRFGSGADARWSRFKGGLTQLDRMELLLRDADAEWPSAFGAHGIFSLGFSGDDEPFGPEWPSLVPQRAAKLWNEEMAEELAANEGKLSHALARIADAWGLSLGRLSTPDVGPNDRLLVVGPTAIVAVARAFEAGKALSLTEQVTVVATPAAHRQLGLFLTAALDQRAATRVLGATEVAAFKLPKAIRLVESKDAHAEDLAIARKRMEGGR